MSHVKTKQQANPFQNALSPKTVGATYGARRANQVSTQPAQVQVPRKPTDKFINQRNNTQDLKAFDANADFKKSRRIGDGAYQNPNLYLTEKGLAHKKSYPLGNPVKEVNDPMRLAFLEKIIAADPRPKIHNPRR